MSRTSQTTGVAIVRGNRTDLNRSQEFYFIRTCQRHGGLSDRAQPRNFDIGDYQDDFIFYELLLRPPGDPGHKDTFKVLESGPLSLEEVNRIARKRAERPHLDYEIQTSDYEDIVISGINQAEFLDVIEVCGGINQILECLRDAAFHYRELIALFNGGDQLEGRDVLEQGPLSGIFLAGDFGPENSPEKSALLVRIPYLGLEQQLITEISQESWSLLEYWSKVMPSVDWSGVERGDREIPVHEAVFIVFNNEVVMVSRSKEDNHGRMVLPRQDRFGAFHVLVHMVAETLRSWDTSVLASLKSEAALCELQPHTPKGKQLVSQSLLLVSTTSRLVYDQTIILKDLKDLFEHAVRYHRNPDATSNIYTKNMINIPVLSGNIEHTKKQTQYVLAALDEIIEERRLFGEKCVELTATIREARKVISWDSAAATQQKEVGKTVDGQTDKLTRELVDQKAETKALTDELSFQGRILSVFTVVTSLFLPLNFFTQYFQPSPDDKSPGRKGWVGESLPRFWVIVAPLTALIVGLAGFYVVKSQYEFRQLGRFLWDLVPRGYWHPPLEKPNAHAQRRYLKNLPQYKIIASDNYPDRYLEEPDDKSSGSSLKFGPNPGKFRFDEQSGILFCDSVDRYDFMCYVTCDSSFPIIDNKLKLYWKQGRMVMEDEPYEFMGKFQVQQPLGGSGFLEWLSCDERKRWDAEKTQVSKIFVINNARELSVLDNRQNSSPCPSHHQLKLHPVD